MKTKFSDFFKELNGYEPFPWQLRLSEQIMVKGWPKNISLPTAAGKTACIDIHIFLLACSAVEKDVARQSRRLWFVVDRRLVVDEAHERANQIAKKLNSANQGLLKEVADALASLSNSRIPLVVSKLHGGSVIDNDWSSSIDQPSVLTSTVDQCGSRMLFRGYGVSQYSRPIHAAMAGCDSLIIVDEAHLSESFIQTARSVSEISGGRFQNTVVELSATGKNENTFELQDDDMSHPILQKRINASKRAALVKIKIPEDTLDNGLALAERMASEAQKLAEKSLVIGCISNSVIGARRVFKKLLERGCDGILLTGRCRPIERDALIKEHMHKFVAGRKATKESSCFFVVATQCVEVGANLDFDALVTEIAPLDSLRQRFGRLNRLGLQPESKAVIVGTNVQLKPHYEHPVYLKTLSATWKWLEKIQEGSGRNRYVDFGILAMAKSLKKIAPNLDDVLVPKIDPPLLLEPDLDLLCKTNLDTPFDSSIPLYLHGEYEVGNEVNIVWRSDLFSDQEQVWADCVSLLPPSSRESMSLPKWTVVAWLEGKLSPDAYDLPSDSTAPNRNSKGHNKTFILRTGPNEIELTSDVGKIRSGATVIVPCGYGGCDSFGWNPDYLDCVADFAEKSVQEATGRIIARLLVGEGEVEPELAREIQSAIKEDNTDALRKFLQKNGSNSEDHLLLQLSHKPFSLDFHPSGKGYIVKEARVQRKYSQNWVILENHIKGVSAIAKNTAELLGLGSEFTDALERAGLLHDIGKADPRFQEILHGDSIDAASAVSNGVFLAKSYSERRLLDSFYPTRERHECVSLSMIKNEPELVRYLVGCHHGRGRPFFPPIDSNYDDLVKFSIGNESFEGSMKHGYDNINSGWITFFDQIQKRHGIWFTALLESVLRLADWEQSRREEENGN